MKHAKRISFWALFALFVALSVWWCLYFPYSPENLLRAVPLKATFVSRHENLAGRWDEFVKNPVIQHLLSAMDLDPDAIKKAEGDGEIKLAAEQYAGRDVVVAYVPALPGSGSPAWVMASWGGARAQILRGYAECGLIKGLAPVDLGYGRKGWTVVQENRKEKDAILSVTAVEGVILGCLSDDPAGVRHLVARVEGRAAVLPAVRGWLAAESGGGRPADAAPRAADTGTVARTGAPSKDMNAPDKGWMALPFSRTGVEFRIRSCVAERLEGIVSGDLESELPGSGAWVTPEACAQDARQMGEALRQTPAALLVAPLDALDSWFIGRGTKRELRALVGVVRNHAAEQTPGFIALCKPEYNGHILSFGVPSAVVGIKLKEPPKAPELIASCLDLLNAGYGFGLIPKNIEIGGRPVTVIEGVNKNGYGKLKSGEQIAVVLREDWLILASNREGLTKMMEAWSPSAEPGKTGWAGDLSSSAAPYFTWFDLHSACKTAGTVLALYDLMSLASGSETDPEIRRNLALLKSWLEAIRPMKTCRFALRPDGRSFTMDFGLGREP